MISHDYDDKHLDGKGLDYLIEQLDVRYGGGGSTPVLDDYYTEFEIAHDIGLLHFKALGLEFGELTRIVFLEIVD